jgi:guanylate kinase
MASSACRRRRVQLSAEASDEERVELGVEGEPARRRADLATRGDRVRGEVDGRDYHFVTVDQFEHDLAAGRFLEHAQVFGKHFYGTPREPVERALREGRLIILDIDVQGALQVRRGLPSALMVFVLPPSDAELLRRLHDRGRDDEDAIRRRFAEAQREIAIAKGSRTYDEFIVNDDLEAATERIARLVAGRLGPARTPAATRPN